MQARRPAILALAAMLAAAYFAILLYRAPGYLDEGLMVCGATRILQGQIPYRDFYTGYPPGEFYALAAVFRVCGVTLLSARIWDSLGRLAMLTFALLLALRAGGQIRAVRLPLVCALAFTGAVGFYLYPMIAAMLPAMAAAWCAAEWFAGRAWPWLCAAGALTGVTVLYRHDLAVCIGIAIAAAVVFEAFRTAQRRGISPALVFACGVLLPVVPVTLWLWLRVPHLQLAASFLDFPRISAAARRVPLPPLRSGRSWQILYLPLTILVGTAVAWVRMPVARQPARLMLLAACALTLLLATEREDPAHAFPAVVFGLLLLAVTPLGKYAARGLELAALGCYILLPIAHLQRANLDPGAPMPDHRAPELPRAGPIRLPPDERMAAAYIAAHTPPGTPVYVGLPYHGLQFVNDAMFYFLAARPNPTPYDMLVPGVTNTAAVEAEMAGDLKARRVPYVVLVRMPASHEPNLSSVDSGVTLLDDAIRRDYREQARFGRYTILRRGDD